MNEYALSLYSHLTRACISEARSAWVKAQAFAKLDPAIARMAADSARHNAALADVYQRAAEREAGKS